MEFDSALFTRLAQNRMLSAVERARETLMQDVRQNRRTDYYRPLARRTPNLRAARATEKTSFMRELRAHVDYVELIEAYYDAVDGVENVVVCLTRELSRLKAAILTLEPGTVVVIRVWEVSEDVHLLITNASLEQLKAALPKLIVTSNLSRLYPSGT